MSFWRIRDRLAVAALALACLCAARAQELKQSWMLSAPPAASGPITAYLDGCTPAGDACAAGPLGLWAIDTRGQWRRILRVPVQSLALARGELLAGTGSLVEGNEGGSGLLASDDGGQSWTSVGAGVFEGLVVTRIAVDPDLPAHWLITTVAAGAGAQGLYETFAAGASWHLVAGGAAWDVLWRAAGDVDAVVGEAILRSTDDGLSFAPLQSGALPAAWRRAALAAEPDGTLLALFSGTPAGVALASSPDGGATWSALAPPPDLFAGSEGDALALAADRIQPGQFWLGGARVWTTDDDAQDWTAVSPPSLPVNQRVISASDDGDLHIGNDGGLFHVRAGTPAYVVSFTTATPATAVAASTISLTALVLSNGQPATGVTVQWAASSGTAPAPTVTGSSGTASATFMVPSNAGSIFIYATAGSTTVAQVLTIEATAAPASLMLVSGGNQQGSVGTRLQPFVVEVEDQYGNGLANQAVTFSDGGAGGTFSPAAATTGSSGQVSTLYMLPMTAGIITFTANAGVLTTSWQAAATAAPNFQLLLGTTPTSVSPLVELPLQVVAVGSYSGSVSVVCLEPATGCNVSPATVPAGGSAVVSITPNAAAPGSGSLQVAVVGTDSAAGLQQQATATLALPEFSIATATGSMTVTAGAASSQALSLAPINGFSGAVSFTATLSDGSPLPPELAAVFTPSTLELAAGAVGASTTLSITASSAAAAMGGGDSRSSPRSGLLALFSLLLAGGLAMRRRLRVLAPAALVLWALGCGGVVAPAPTTTTAAAAVYSVNVVASSGALQVTAPLTVTVEP